MVNWLDYTTKNLANPYIPLCHPPPIFPSFCLPCWISSVILSCCGGNKENKRTGGDSKLLIHCRECWSGALYRVLDRLAGLVLLWELGQRTVDSSTESRVRKRWAGGLLRGSVSGEKGKRQVSKMLCVRDEGSLSEVDGRIPELWWIQTEVNWGLKPSLPAVLKGTKCHLI